ncbi:MAG TPA: helix-turn-helix domain-containing protein [Vicinamibacterales bacterium]|nr:helix-turn-helix domain-containing protein [Vicinamibacterales bacterium]
MGASVSLRDEHAAAARERILSAVAELVERGEPEELTMPDVAAASGISLRTIYRYYPTREKLIEAAGRWIGNELMRHPYPRTLDEVADLFEVGCPDFDKRPGLVRALALSRLGRRVRGYRRRERLGAISRALRAELAAAPQAEIRRAEAVLGYLHNMLAYTTLREESGLDGEEIGRAIAWAIRTLINDLRRRYR